MPEGGDDSRKRIEALRILDEAFDEPLVRVGDIVLSSPSFWTGALDRDAVSCVLGSAMAVEAEVFGFVEA